MKYHNFEEVPVWQDGTSLTVRVFEVTEDKAFLFKGDIANQMQRAALSIPNNIAEGFERGTTPELIMFLYYAKGSAGEVRSICHVCSRLACFGHLGSEISDLTTRAAAVSRQLSGWAMSLQESEIEGPRRLTERKRETFGQKKRAAEFVARLKADAETRLRALRPESQERT